MGYGAGEGQENSPTPTSLLIFDSQPPPWYKFLSLPSLLLPLKSKMVAKIFVKKIPSICLPKLHLPCRLKWLLWVLLWCSFLRILTTKIKATAVGALKSICRFWWLFLKLSDLVYFDSLTLVKLFTCTSFHG